MKLNTIAVFCGSSLGKDTVYGKQAYDLAKYMAENNAKIVFGGGKIGVMGALADGALDHGAYIIGVIPKFLTHKEVVHSNLSELVLTENMHQRKAIMTELSDAFIILPGGFGTMEEFFEVLTWAQLGLHNKPIGILNVNSYFDHLIKFFDEMVSTEFLKLENKNMVLISDTMEDLIEQMENYIAPQVPKWLEKGHT